MPQKSTGKLRSKLFTLLVLIFGLIAFGGGEPIREAEAGLNDEIYGCTSDFNSGLDQCLSTYTGCTGSQCGPNYASCFGDKADAYSDCLTGIDVEFNQDTCTEAIIAAQVCEALMDACMEEYAMDTSQEFTCLGKSFECRNASGIDRCQ